ncbi:alpha/beta hydrolase [Tsukamurella pseudospumae]|uniref:DUF1023 domain-containing protein n=1 Tax=Tsukamurella pseudospumae TaxID=239498 RepID=A0A137ZYH3_9ACTN|nr:alpha/beta hydrolase [Tsukamurella pseudospumae]KXP03258.1 hypothetical protein AXK60_15545 [Tsukamurella pseudospumae]
MVVIGETAWRGTAADAYAGWAAREGGALRELAVAIELAEREILAGGGGLAERLAAIDLPAAPALDGADAARSPESEGGERWGPGRAEIDQVALGAPSLPVPRPGRPRSAARRDEENRARLAADLRALRGKRRSRAERAELEMLERLSARLAELDRTGRTVQLFDYDPTAFGGDGIAVVAIGDLDTAQNVGVVVPGMGTTAASIGDVSANAVHLYDAAARADPARSTATVAWIGYDAPSGRASPFEVRNRAAARQGAFRLQDDLRDIAALRAVADARVVVFGHSYGSTTTALAGADGALAGTVDAMVLVGSPGVGSVGSTAELGVPVFVARHPDDPVPLIGRTDGVLGSVRRLLGVEVGLGADPSAPSFGATPLPVDGARGFGLAAHSGYFAEGSRSLDAFAAVLTGGSDRAR